MILAETSLIGIWIAIGVAIAGSIPAIVIGVFKKGLKQTIRETVEPIVTEHTDPIKEDLRLIKEGTQAGLRHDLLEIGSRYNDLTETNIQEIQQNPKQLKLFLADWMDFENMYTKYHRLAENGEMDKCYVYMKSLANKVGINTNKGE